MSGVIGDIKKLFKFKFKARSDTFTDQFHRLFMTRAMLVGAFLTGLSWYKDKVNCIIPKAFNSAVDGFAPKACWINGFYVFKELMEEPNFSGYFGIPNEMGDNGTTFERVATGLETCVAGVDSESCKPMQKLFFLQFQWFPFYMAAMALLYYLPYIMHQKTTEDLQSFKGAIRSQEPDVEKVIKNYFNRETNQLSRQQMRIAAEAVVKLFYLIANICVFRFTDNLLNNQFVDFGQRWISWSKLSNFDAYNYVGIREFFKPGEQLLPAYGLCDVLELGKDVKIQVKNEYTLVCEISQHILYQYVLIAIWMLIIVGFVLSCLGIILLFLKYLMRNRSFLPEEVAAKEVYYTLSLREAEYMDYVYKRNIEFYGTLVRALHGKRIRAPEVAKPNSHLLDDTKV